MKEKKDIIEAQRKAFDEGCVLFNTCEGVVKMKLKDIVNQPTDGLLYDLNRDEATVTTIFDEQKLMNELATINVLKFLHRRYKDGDFCCGGCKFFEDEDAYGNGFCPKQKNTMNCENVCGMYNEKK